MLRFFLVVREWWYFCGLWKVFVCWCIELDLIWEVLLGLFLDVVRWKSLWWMLLFWSLREDLVVVEWFFVVLVVLLEWEVVVKISLDLGVGRVVLNLVVKLVGRCFVMIWVCILVLGRRCFLLDFVDEDDVEWWLLVEEMEVVWFMDMVMFWLFGCYLVVCILLWRFVLWYFLVVRLNRGKKIELFWRRWVCGGYLWFIVWYIK